MYLSKRSNGRYYIYYTQLNGKMTCISTGTKLKTEALIFLSEFEAEQKERLKRKLIPITLKQFFFDFLRYSESIHSRNHNLSLKTTFNQFDKFIGDIILMSLTREKVLEYTEKRLNSVSNYAVRRDLANLSSAFNYAISKKYLDENPCKGIKKPRIIEKLPLFFSEAEFQVLLRVIDDNDLKDLVKFAVNTGLRQSDLINLEWSQINFKDKSLILDNRNSHTKSRKVHTLPLNMNALQILTERQIVNSKSERVFTFQGKPIKQFYISHKFKKFVQKAGLNPQLTFHKLRSTFSSWLIQKGASIYQVSKLLTHADIRVTQVYTHLRSEDLRVSVDLLNN